MTKIDLITGILGSGKTTFIIKYAKYLMSCGMKIAILENDFGAVNVDMMMLQDLKGDSCRLEMISGGCDADCHRRRFKTQLIALGMQHFDRIIIEPSGVGKLSDVIRAVQNIGSEDIVLNAFTTVVDAGKCKMYMKNFGEFFNDQVEHAGTVIMSHADVVSPEKLKAAVELVKEKNPNAVIVTTPIEKLDGKTLLDAIERKDTLEAAIEHLEHEHDDDDEDDHEHCHHHHDDDEDEHGHHHDHGDGCTCGCHDRDGHHRHHHADEVFVSWGTETTKKYTKEELEEILDGLCDEKKFGVILRAKGIVEDTDGGWIHFDYIPGETDVRTGSAGITGRLCVIGSKLNEDNITKAFGA